MNNFYVSMIFIGIIMIAISLVWIAFDKKSSFSLMNRFEEKRQDMISIISDAEEMIIELNKFSDYIITQIDNKNQELQKSLRIVDNEIEQLNIKSDKINEVNTDQVEKDFKEVEKATSDVELEDKEADKKVLTFDRTVPKLVKNEKVVSLSSKHNEVVKLSNNGLNETEIAKKLNMGKGEIQLILELNK